MTKHITALWALHKFGRSGVPGQRAGLGVRCVDKTGAGPSRPALNANNLANETGPAGRLSCGDC